LAWPTVPPWPYCCYAAACCCYAAAALSAGAASAVRWRGRCCCCCYAAAAPSAGMAGNTARWCCRQLVLTNRHTYRQTDRQTDKHPGTTIRPTLCERDATDRRTDGIAIAYTRLAYMLSRVKMEKVSNNMNTLYNGYKMPVYLHIYFVLLSSCTLPKPKNSASKPDSSNFMSYITYN